MDYNEHSIKTIASNIKRTLSRLNIKSNIEIRNYGKVILVENDKYGTEEHLYFWIRLLPSRDLTNSTYKIELSTVVIPKSLRRKGVFTSIINSLNNCKYIDSVWITSVCTPEMFGWCNKNGTKLRKVGECDFEVLKKSSKILKF